VVVVKAAGEILIYTVTVFWYGKCQSLLSGHRWHQCTARMSFLLTCVHRLKLVICVLGGLMNAMHCDVRVVQVRVSEGFFMLSCTLLQ
jgi:hypothetical protein